MLTAQRLPSIGDQPVGKFEISDIPSIAALRAINTGDNGYNRPFLEDGSFANVTGYYSKNDGGGGVFVFDAYSVAADNGGTVIAPSQGDGRWIRQCELSSLDIKWFGARGDGASNDHDAIQAAVDALPADGGEIYFPAGDFRCGSTVTVGISGVRVRGEGWFSSHLRRLNDTNVPLLKFTAGQGSIQNMRFVEANECINTGSLIELEVLSDFSISNVWTYGGYNALVLDRADNIQLRGCTMEGSRGNLVYGYQASLLLITGNTFFAMGLNEALAPAAINLVKDSEYTFRPNSITIVGNYFNYGRYAHFIHAAEVVSLTISGNFFHLAGMYNAGSKDDINLSDCQYVSITGNTSASVYNNYIPGNRGSRYCVNITDVNCSGVRVLANAFQPGTAGTVNDLGTDSEIVSSINAVASTLPNGIKTTKAGAKLSWDVSGVFFSYIEAAGIAGSGNNYIRIVAGNQEVARFLSSGKMEVEGSAKIKGTSTQIALANVAPDPDTNSTVIMQRSSDEQLTFKVKGADGTVRFGHVALAP